MGYYGRRRRYSYHQNNEQRKQLAEAEEKLTGKLNELSFIKCMQCSGKIVRVFKPAGVRTPAYHGDVNDYIHRMQATMARCTERGVKNENYIAGPEYTLVFSHGHFVKPHSDVLSSLNSHGHCGVGVIVGQTPVEIAARFLLRRRPIRNACIVNGVSPQEVKDWLGTLESDDLSTMFGYGFKIISIPETELWAGMFKPSELQGNTISQEIVDACGSEWAAELDPVISHTPPTNGQLAKYIMAPTQGGVHYCKSDYKADLAIELPTGVEYADLHESTYDRIVDIVLPNGVPAKLRVSKKGAGAFGINSLTRKLDEMKAPRRFWVVQPEAYRGTSEIQTGDLVL